MTEIEQFFMAYGVEHDRLRAILPAGFTSLRPVLRINGEIRAGESGYLELNTPVEREGFRGWLNIGFRENVPFERRGDSCVVYRTDLLEISFRKVGISGSCPAEKDNDGCIFLTAPDCFELRPPEAVTANKEFCDCSFEWLFSPDTAKGKSLGKTLPAFPEAVENIYPQVPFTVQNAAMIPCRQVLGAYAVSFIRKFP